MTHLVVCEHADEIPAIFGRAVGIVPQASDL